MDTDGKDPNQRSRQSSSFLISEFFGEGSRSASRDVGDEVAGRSM